MVLKLNKATFQKKLDWFLHCLSATYTHQATNMLFNVLYIDDFRKLLLSYHLEFDLHLEN